jgi:hypothetical protein
MRAAVQSQRGGDVESSSPRWASSKVRIIPKAAFVGIAIASGLDTKRVAFYDFLCFPKVKISKD